MRWGIFTNYFIARKINKNVCFFIPTDTVCGLLCKEQKIIYELKQREINKRIVLFINDIKFIKNLSYQQINFLKQYWPGNLTVIKDQISYRIPNIKPLLKILKKTGPLYCSSANISHCPTINNWKQAKQVFKDKISYIKNRYYGNNVASTIIDIDHWTIIREGENINEIKKYINKNIFNS